MDAQGRGGRVDGSDPRDEGGLAGAARLVLFPGVAALDEERALFDAMLEGWARQQRSRLLNESTVATRRRLVRRFAAFTGEYPWQWRPQDLEDFTTSLRAGSGGRTHATLRGYQGALRLFGVFVTDPRYGWAAECEARFGTHPVQICHEWNTAVHAVEFEGRPGRRALSLSETQALFDHADSQVGLIVSRGRKGSLAAFRDAALLKVVYGWGLRRSEAVMLDLADCRANPKVAKFAGFGALQVRFGKASRGSAPKRRTVLSVFDWAVEALAEYVDAVRPDFGAGGHPALWVTERGTRLSARYLDARFSAYREALGWPVELDLHCLRHSYVTHLIEAGYPERFVSEQVGHSHASTTAIYTSVGDDYKNRVLAQVMATMIVDRGGGEEP